MVCESCESVDLAIETVNIDYRYSSYLNEYVKEDTVKFKCEKCNYEWLETF